MTPLPNNSANKPTSNQNARREPTPEQLHPAALPDEELWKQVRLTRGRDGGPGGQHRNKVETKVTLQHSPSGVEVQASERRSAEENRKVAFARLRLALATQVRRPPVARDSFGDVASDLWRERSRGGVISCNPAHRDFATLLAEALDVIEDCGQDAKKAALRLSVTASQLVKLVKDHPAAFELWNRKRAERALHPLK
ncbi:MAG: peptide chain release factor-like protein [Phycisphaerales bacterium]|nr:peptide chain release factor-like protein [Phycisphaerales bacterium]